MADEPRAPRFGLSASAVARLRSLRRMDLLDRLQLALANELTPRAENDCSKRLALQYPEE
jgi:hypothetical protein